MAELKNTEIQGSSNIRVPSGPVHERPVIKTYIEAFTSTGTTSWTAPTGVSKIEVLVVAGGGAGASSGVDGGGGGAGGLIYNGDYAVTPGSSYTVTVGIGGEAADPGNNGGNSVFDNIVALGGGGGAGSNNAQNGGSGGGGYGTGGTSNHSSFGTGTIGQGHDGGIGNDDGAGGGGAGGPGSNAFRPGYTTGDGMAGAGGPGVYFSQFKDYGENGWFAGGGGGGGENPGRGGIGGGGDGAPLSGSNNGAPGLANTGGGGGGTNNATGAPGGSGVVLIRYQRTVQGTSTEGYARFNTDINSLETYDGIHAGWIPQAAGFNYAGNNFALYSSTVGQTGGVSKWNQWESTDTVVFNNAEDPFGGNRATLWHGDGGTSVRHTIQLQNAGHSPSKDYCWSVFVKARGDQRRIALETANYSTWSNPTATVFDIVNGTVITNQSRGEIIDYGDGWFRIYMNARTGSGTTSNSGWYINLVDGTSTSYNSHIAQSDDGVYLFGAQDEEGTKFPSSYTEAVDAISPVPYQTGEYKVHKYTNVGTSYFTPTSTGPVEVLVVAGGGAAGNWNPNNPYGGGGGGAGGLIYRAKYDVISDQTYKVVVGNGGQEHASTGNGAGKRGEDSQFGTLVAIGGGGGGRLETSATSGGSGGGAGGHVSINGQKRGGAGVFGQGHRGGHQLGSSKQGGGGGGGAGGPGQDNMVADGGNGGDGLEFAITGTPTYYAGGGGGGAGPTTSRPGRGGRGGGGDGGTTNTAPGQDGTPNTGGGGGGWTGGNNPNSPQSATGGSGIVIVRYKNR